MASDIFRPPPREKAGGRYTVGFFLRLPARSPVPSRFRAEPCFDLVNEKLIGRSFVVRALRATAGKLTGQREPPEVAPESVPDLTQAADVNLNNRLQLRLGREGWTLRSMSDKDHDRAVRYRRLALAEPDKAKAALLQKIADEAERGVLCTVDRKLPEVVGDKSSNS